MKEEQEIIQVLSLKLIVIVFFSSTISSHVTTELSNKYLRFSQVHKLRFKTH